MNDLKVFILTEGGRNIGFGHITRCLSLYHAFEEKGIKPKFFINGDDSVVDIVRQTDYEIVSWIKSKQEFLNKIMDADIVIIDSYLAGVSFYEEVSKAVKIPVYIDDNKRLDYPKGVVVNGNVHANDLNYPKKDGVIYLLGTKYTPLRKAFWDVPKKKIRETVQSFMIAFGGDDMKDLTPKVLAFLCKSYPYLEKNVIIGKGFKNINEIEKMADKKTNLIYYPDAEKIKQVMLKSDIAISAGGQTLYELARVGVPTIVIGIADNQLGNIKGWQKAGFIEYAGWWENEKVFDNIRYCVKELIKSANRKKISDIGRTLVDGKGVKRLVKSWRRI
jgi:UDP-2,4-diacetamido-2,4,6-trideoxy-beta-L-altropyranose hydrolase